MLRLWHLVRTQQLSPLHALGVGVRMCDGEVELMGVKGDNPVRRGSPDDVNRIAGT